MNESDPRIELLWRNLATVIDPEIGLDIVTLGLVYGVQIEDDVALITHTLTTPGCPMERIITDGIRAATMQTDGVCGVETKIVWEPAWHSGMIAPNARGSTRADSGSWARARFAPANQPIAMTRPAAKGEPGWRQSVLSGSAIWAGRWRATS